MTNAHYTLTHVSFINTIVKCIFSLGGACIWRELRYVGVKRSVKLQMYPKR